MEIHWWRSRHVLNLLVSSQPGTKVPIVQHTTIIILIWDVTYITKLMFPKVVYYTCIHVAQCCLFRSQCFPTHVFCLSRQYHHDSNSYLTFMHTQTQTDKELLSFFQTTHTDMLTHTFTHTHTHTHTHTQTHTHIPTHAHMALTSPQYYCIRYSVHIITAKTTHRYLPTMKTFLGQG